MVFGAHSKPFSTANIKWVEDRTKEDVGGILLSTETYTKVTAPSGLIDKKDSKSKILTL